jgi:hypothetical protein
VSTERRRIFAFSGVLKPQPGGPPPGALVDFAVSLAAAGRPVRRLCYIPTAVGEAVTILPGRHAWHVTPDGNGRYAEQAIIPRLITTDQA